MRNGIHTLRGQLSLPMTAPLRSPMFNGSFTKNFKVESIHIFPVNTVNNDTIVIMHFDDVLKTAADANDNGQFGWANLDNSMGAYDYVDPDHIIVNDLFVSAIAANPGLVNYIIKLKRVTSTMPEAILDEVKNRLQS